LHDNDGTRSVEFSTTTAGTSVLIPPEAIRLRRSLLSISFYHLLRVADRLVGNFHSAQHARDLRDSVALGEMPNAGVRNRNCSLYLNK
jgi:hypothetical protein